MNIFLEIILNQGIGFYLTYVLVPLIPVLLWFFFGRDPQIKKGPVTAWYSPPKHSDGTFFSPAEAGLLIDESIGSQELIGTMVELIRKGFLVFNNAENTLQFQQLEDRSTLSDEEREVLHLVFQGEAVVALDKLDWQLIMRSYRKNVIDRLIKYGYFVHNPFLVQAGFVLISVIIARVFEIPLLYLTMFFGLAMSKKTELGREQYVVLVSFRNFLRSQRHQWEYQGEQEITTDKFLAYATAFDLVPAWDKKFSAIERDLKKKDRHATMGDISSSIETAIRSLSQ